MRKVHDLCKGVQLRGVHTLHSVELELDVLGKENGLHSHS